MAATTWNPADKYSNVTLSNGNLTATGLNGVGAPQCTRGTNPKTSGKWYFEVHYDTKVTGIDIGVDNGSTGLSSFTYPGNTDSNGVTYAATGYVYHQNDHAAPPNIGSYTTGDVIGVALDASAGTVWFSKNGTWNGDPAGGTGGYASSDTTFYPYCGPINNDACTGRWASASLTYTPPTGFSAWDGSSGTVWQFTSSVASIWSETAAITRIRQMASTSVSASWVESSVVSRVRQLSPSTAAQTFSETSLLGRIRQFGASSAASAFSQSSALSRLRSFVSSAASAFTQTSSFAQLKQLGASAVSAAWSQSSTVRRIRSAVSSVASAWAENSSVQRLRGFVASSVAKWSETASLARLRGFSTANASQWSESSALARLRGFNSQGSAQWSETSVLVRQRSLSPSTVAAIWSETAVIGSIQHPLVTTPTSRRIDGTVTARRIDPSEPSRRIAPNLQLRRSEP